MPKICPLLAIASYNRPPILGLEKCQEADCAWWLPETELIVNGVSATVPGKCSVTEAGASLSGMVYDGIFTR